MGKRDRWGSGTRIPTLPNKNLSTRCNNNTIRLRLRILILSFLLYLVLDSGSLSTFRSLRLRLRRRRLRFGFLDNLEDFLRIKDKLAFDCYALFLLTFFPLP